MKVMYRAAMGLAKAISELETGLESVARTKGFEQPPAKHNKRGTYLHVELMSREEGGCVLFFPEHTKDWVPWAEALARELKCDIQYLELSGVNKMAEADDTEAAYELKARYELVTPTGSRSVPMDMEEEPVCHGDFHETLSLELQHLMEDKFGTYNEEKAIAFYCPPKNNEVDPRLEQLAEELTQAKGYQLKEMYGASFLEIRSPDGSKRMARLDPSELETLRKISGLPIA